MRTVRRSGKASQQFGSLCAACLCKCCEIDAALGGIAGGILRLVTVQKTWIDAEGGLAAAEAEAFKMRAGKREARQAVVIGKFRGDLTDHSFCSKDFEDIETLDDRSHKDRPRSVLGMSTAGDARVSSAARDKLFKIEGPGAAGGMAADSGQRNTCLRRNNARHRSFKEAAEGVGVRRIIEDLFGVGAHETFLQWMELLDCQVEVVGDDW